MQNEAACVCAYIWALTNAQYTQHLFTQPQTIRLKKKLNLKNSIAYPKQPIVSEGIFSQ